VETPDEPYRKFSANADWPEKKLVEHLVDLTRFVFTEAHEVRVESIRQNDWTSHFDISITPTPNESALRRFSSAVAILFVPIGCRVGRMIYANVRK
jgi:hypothetical protein